MTKTNAMTAEAATLLMPAIAAEVHTDDRIYEVNFDAAAYFAQASDEDLRELHKCGWGCDYPADNVAHFMETVNPDVGAMFTYNARSREPGFECNVEGGDAMTWLQTHRPVLYEELNAIDNG